MAHPKDIATWLEIARKQRQRQATSLSQQFGPSSPAAIAVEAEVANIQEAIIEFTKEAAKQPIKK